MYPVVRRTDAASGRESGRLTLDGVFGGVWRSSRAPVNGQPVVNAWSPGYALAPDGRTMAVVYAGGDQVAFVDLWQMRVSATHGVARAQSWLDRLGPLALDAQAKGEDGWSWNATYAPDDGLLVWGNDHHESDQGGFVWNGHGLRLLQASTGTILAEALPGQIIDQVLPAPDGGAVYVTANPSSREGQASPLTVYRLDARTLKMSASRPLSSGTYADLVFLRQR